VEQNATALAGVPRNVRLKAANMTPVQALDFLKTAEGNRLEVMFATMTKVAGGYSGVQKLVSF
jgi:hypothetical protein